MEYKVNWKRHFYIAMGSSSVFIVFVILRIIFNSNWLASVFMYIVCFVWLICLTRAIFDPVSYIKIENGIITHCNYSFSRKQYLMSELVSYKVEKSTLPGVLRFKSGEILRLSIADNLLVTFLKAHYINVEIISNA